MTNTWIDAIYDRTYNDVQELIYNPALENPKGCFNAADLNRIENNTAYVMEYMLERKIIRTAPSLRIKTNWSEGDIVIASEMKRIIENISVLCESSNPEIQDDLPSLYLGTQINYSLANDMEKALDIMHTQPDLPISYFELSLVHGIITTVERLDGTTETINADTCMIAEDEIAHISGTPYGENAQYQTFTIWSGDNEDLRQIGDIAAQNTTYVGQYHSVEFTANFRTDIPRTLTLSNAYISVNGDYRAETGPTTGSYYAGDNVMIIADIAPNGKIFYCWDGTQAALDAISEADTNPSTIWLAMPDCDVQLSPIYINAGQHYVNVTDGSGSGTYIYRDTVNISANVPSHYKFDNWSGDTRYLTDIHNPTQSFSMPDEDLNFRANCSYNYSYNAISIVNGSIGGETYIQEARQGNTYTLVPSPPSEDYGLDYWEVNGLGTVNGNTFTVGDGNATVTGYYNPLYTLTINNVNNAEGINNYRIVQNHEQTISTNTYSGNYKFDGWYENGTKISSNTSYNVNIGESNRNIEARYVYAEDYTVTLINRNNSGQTTTSQVVSGTNWSSYTNENVDNYLLVGWYIDNTLISSSTSCSLTVTENVTIEVVYRQKDTYTLTVENGTGSGTYNERQSVTVTALIPQGYRFTGWSIISGSLYSSPSSATSTVIIGSSDATIRANYSALRNITVNTNSGSSLYVLSQGSSQSISALPAPSNYEFDRWSITSGDATLANYLSQQTQVYVQTQNSTVTAIYKAIPSFTVEVENGYVQINNQWVSSGTTIRNSNPSIKMKPAPEGYRFLQWEVVTGTNDDVYLPSAESTTLRNVTHNIKVRATYYIPNPEATYTATVIQHDGTIETYNNPQGYQQNISAYQAPEGYAFYRWDGDYQYLTGGKYNDVNTINTPAKNISVEATYVRQGYMIKYHLYMLNAECLISRGEDEETGEIVEVWATDGEFYENEEIEIRPLNIPFGWKFDGWEGTENRQTALIDDITSENTFITMSYFDCYITAKIIEEDKYTMQITGGQTSGQYYENARVDIYFDKEDDEDIHYTFNRWVGEDLQYLELYDGGEFDATNPGSINEPQYVKMPARRINISSSYTTYYHLVVNGGTIDSQDEYFAENTQVPITADTIQGRTFNRWTGDVSGILNVYDPTTIITMSDMPINITATFTDGANRNNIGYVLTSLINNNTINIENITVISGNVNRGFIITDNKGHIYIITSVTDNIATITRLTKIQKGGNVYE